MQNDLISRKRVIENIWDVFNSYANDSQRFDEYETEAINNAFTVLQKVVENQPTAYNVEKVVAELEQLEDKDTREVYMTQHIVLDEAIEIVRNGGKE